MKHILRSILVAILTLEARLILKKYKPRIVAVSGSVGKTSTKDAVYVALSEKYFVRKSQKSFNSEIGVPLTILGRPNAWNNPFLWAKNIVAGLVLIFVKEQYPEWLVLEVGSDHPGDIAALAKWLSVDAVILTRFPDLPVHVEYFDSPDAVNDEDFKIVHALTETGTLIINKDDHNILKRTSGWKGSVVTYGFHEGSEIQGRGLQNVLTNDVLTSGITLIVNTGGETANFTLPGVLGAQHAYPLLAATAMGVQEGVTLSELRDAFQNHIPSPGRMRILKGEKGTMIVDDSYNASPVAVEEAVTTLKSLTTHRRTIVAFGDMLELGSHSIEAHKIAGKQLAEVADILLTVGVRAHFSAKSAHAAGMKKKTIFECRDAEEAGQMIESMMEEGDVIFVKGSQSIRMERCIEQFMANPQIKEELLARQDAEWLKR